MTDPTPAMQPEGLCFLDFPREIRDAVYTHFFRRKYTVRIPKYLSNQTNSLKTETSPSSSLVLLQTSKQINEEASQLLYAAGSFHFPSDVLMKSDLNLIGHKIKLLRSIELHFDMDWYYTLNPEGRLRSYADSTCNRNISLLAAGRGGRRHTCSLVFDDYEVNDEYGYPGLTRPPQVVWWDALERLDGFEWVRIKVRCSGWSFDRTYGLGGDGVQGSSRWKEMKKDFRRKVDEDWWYHRSY